MKEDKKKEELQSRRQFFRKAAKTALPILGAVVLSNVPLVSKAAPTNCSYSCGSYCSDGCTAACSRICAGCTTSCHAANCYHSCHSSCDTSCKGSCRLYSY